MTKDRLTRMDKTVRRWRPGWRPALVPVLLFIASSCGSGTGGGAGARTDAGPDVASDTGPPGPTDASPANDQAGSGGAGGSTTGDAGQESPAAKEVGGEPDGALPRDGADAVPPPDGAAGLATPADVVAVLSGERPIDATGRLTNRSTAEMKRRARVYLMSILTAAGLTPREHMFSSSAGPGVNVYVELPATVATPEDAVIFGAHYDTVPGVPGAIDNATGTAMVYAVARTLNTMASRRRPAVMAFFDIHETGTMEGSARFAELIMQRNLKVHSVHTLDQIGWDQNGDRGVEIEQPSAALEALYRTAAQPLGIPVANSNASSDHVSFRTRGFQAIGLSEQYRGGDTTPYYHTVGDRYATVNLPYFESSLRLVLAVVDNLFGP